MKRYLFNLVVRNKKTTLEFLTFYRLSEVGPDSYINNKIVSLIRRYVCSSFKHPSRSELNKIGFKGLIYHIGLKGIRIKNYIIDLTGYKIPIIEGVAREDLRENLSYYDRG